MPECPLCLREVSEFSMTRFRNQKMCHDCADEGEDHRMQEKEDRLLNPGKDDQDAIQNTEAH